MIFPKKFSQIKAIIFDCDGTLVDSEHAHYTAWKEALYTQGHTLCPKFYSTFVGKGHDEVLKIAKNEWGISAQDKLYADKSAHFSSLLCQGIPPMESTVQFLHSLFAKKEALGIKLAVASGARKEEILQNLDNLGVTNYFDAIFSGQDDLSEYTDPEGTNKPKPYVYLKTIKELGLLPHECMAVEDSAPGVAAAVDAGCFTIAVPNQYTHMHDLSRAHLKIESFAKAEVEQFIANLLNPFGAQ